MIKPEIYYEVTCDGCGRKYTEGDTIVAFGDFMDAERTIWKAGWRDPGAAVYGHALCPECNERLIEDERRNDNV